MTTTRTTTRAAKDRAARGDRRGRARRQSPPAAAFLARVAEPVRERLGASVPLAEFLRSAGTLSLAERMLLVDQALVLLEQNYVHLPLKTAMHAVNPLQRLRLLRIRLERQTRATADPEWQFHAEMSQIFHSLRDLHTNYLLPTPYSGTVAYLPFLIEEYTGEQGEPRYLVSHVVQGFTEPGFGPGVEVTHWCGIPIDRAVELNAARFAGSNAAARHSRGLQSLTVRPLVIHVPPDEDWVSLGYRGTDGAARELRHEWLVTENLPPFVADTDAVGAAGATQGVDLEADAAGRAKALLFAPQVVAAMDAQPGTGGQAGSSPGAPAAAGDEVPTSMPQVFRARAVQTAAGVFGHIRIFTFSVDDPAGFVTEFVRLIGLLPQTGLIVDVRDNGGGHIYAAEFTLQALTPRRIQPEPVQFITTPLNLRICRRFADPDGPIDLGPWVPSLDQAREIGATFSGAFPITPAEGANEIGQQLPRPGRADHQRSLLLRDRHLRGRVRRPPDRTGARRGRDHRRRRRERVDPRAAEEPARRAAGRPRVPVPGPAQGREHAGRDPAHAARGGRLRHPGRGSRRDPGRDPPDDPPGPAGGQPRPARPGGGAAGCAPGPLADRGRRPGRRPAAPGHRGVRPGTGRGGPGRPAAYLRRHRPPAWRPWWSRASPAPTWCGWRAGRVASWWPPAPCGRPAAPGWWPAPRRGPAPRSGRSRPAPPPHRTPRSSTCTAPGTSRRPVSSSWAGTVTCSVTTWAGGP